MLVVIEAAAAGGASALAVGKLLDRFNATRGPKPIRRPAMILAAGAASLAFLYQTGDMLKQLDSSELMQFQSNQKVTELSQLLDRSKSVNKALETQKDQSDRQEALYARKLSEDEKKLAAVESAYRNELRGYDSDDAGHSGTKKKAKGSSADKTSELRRDVARAEAEAAGAEARARELDAAMAEMQKAVQIDPYDIRFPKQGLGGSEDKAPPQMKAFPWPPPQASARLEIPLAIPGKATLGAFDARLTKALNATGYAERSYYWIPGGFAVATRMERIDSYGRPWPVPDRYSTGWPVHGTFSILEYFQMLFTAPPGHYRVVVFLVTAVPFSTAPTTVKLDDARQWLQSGLSQLPDPVAADPASRQTKCNALIYEFDRPSAASASPNLLLPSSLAAADHLTGSGLLHALNP